MEKNEIEKQGGSSATKLDHFQTTCKPMQRRKQI